MERVSTLLLRLTVILIGLIILAVCLWGMPLAAREAAGFFPASWFYPALILAYAAAIPFYIALFQALRLLSCIDRNTAFSDLSVQALRNIKYCALSISLIYVASFPFLYLMAQKNDSPGIALIGLIIVFAAGVIAVFAAVLEKLLKNAIAIKYENDLTI